MSIVLYDQISGPKTSGGTWTRVSASGPSAPVTYNGAVDFSATSPGQYIYRYSPNSLALPDETSDVTVNIIDPPIVYNDECEFATTIATHNLTLAGETEAIGVYINDAGDCTVGGVSTLSSDTIPTEWNDTPSADMWFKIPIPTHPSASIQPIITVSSASYLDAGPADGLMIAAYSGSCSSLSLVDAAGPVAQGQLLTITPYLAPSSSTSNLYIRVAITASSGGYFDITIQTNI